MEILKITLALIFFAMGVTCLFLAWQNPQSYRAASPVGTMLLFVTFLLLQRPTK